MSQRVRRSQLEHAARAAIAACDGGRFVAEALRGRVATDSAATWVAGAGKAVAAMADGAARILGAGMRCGPLIGKHSDGNWPIVLAGHPLPDERGVAASSALQRFLGARSDGETVIFLLSGGASALLSATVEGVSLADLRATTEALLRGGATIQEINTVRRHLGLLLGGRMALATAARIEVLALSDVIGDDPATIGSGPVSADPSSFADALEVARRVGVTGAVLEFLVEGTRGAKEETPKPGDPRLARAAVHLLATPATLREEAVRAVRAVGGNALVDEAWVTGDVAEVAARYAAIAATLAPGTVRIAVGEPTVRPLGDGRGGRSQQLALAVARALSGTRLAFLAIGSDGSDGPTDAAGAVVDGDTWQAARALGLDPEAALAGFDAYPLLDRTGALIRTGPTGTNLLDLHLLAG